MPGANEASRFKKDESTLGSIFLPRYQELESLRLFEKRKKNKRLIFSKTISLIKKHKIETLFSIIDKS